MSSIYGLNTFPPVLLAPRQATEMKVEGGVVDIEALKAQVEKVDPHGTSFMDRIIRVSGNDSNRGLLTRNLG